MDITQDGDVWDVNDAVGIYKTQQLHGEQAYYREGITLFEGDIPKKHLERLIKAGLKKHIKFVIEVNETNFASSPNTKKSLDKVLQLI